MTDSDDVAARGRAIFERLRADEPEAAPAGQDAPSPASDGISASGDADGAPAEAGAEHNVAPSEGAPDASDGDGEVGSSEGSAGMADPVPADRASEEGPDPVEASGGADAAGGSPTPAAAPAAQTDALPTASAVVAPPPAPASGLPNGLPGAADLPVVEGALPVADTTPAEERGPEPEPDAPHPFARALPRVMAVANQKGGVGKTTTAVNLGACLADIGYRVLVVDLDPQGNASTGLGINIRDLHGSMYDVILHDLPIEDCVEATSVRNLFCAPSSLDLAGAEIELVPAFSRELRLKRALAEVHDDYDFVLIDCPPSLGLLTVNGLAAATEVVVPIQCEYYALEGLGQLLRNVNLVQRNLNPQLELSAIILVMYDARTKLADQVVSEVRSHFGAKVCRNVVPRTVRLSEAPSFGQPIIAFDPTSRGAIAYRELAKEVSGGTPQRAR
ncbi:MAG TPA: AAA family ATPase [Acidimicrobiales bacterium]|nr:AAA family ATPase [Acidimicrobiales bacterium]